MKTSARFLAMLLAVLMIAGAAMTVSAFSDVEDGYEHATAIATLSQLGVIGGYEDGTFKPNDPVERDEMAKLVYVLYTTFQDAGAGSQKFSDVPAGNWAAGYVAWCSAKNIVGGFGDGTFKPDENVTYDQALKMVCATLGYTDFDSSLWPTDVRQKAITDLKLNAGLEKVNGSDKLTRGQVAQLLYNALDKDMAETKVEYVYDMSYEDGEGNTVPVKVPVEVAKTLAADVWGFEEVVIRVVATENLVFNALSTKTNDGEKIKAVVVNADGTLDTTVETYDLADLGLEAYEDNTDALIGLDIMTIEKNEELLAKATVLGSVKLVKLEVGATNSNDVPEVDQVKIDGVLYKDAKKTETPFTGLEVLAYTSAAVTTSGQYAITVDGDDVADIEYPNVALAMDNEGDGIIDALTVAYYAPYVVTATKEVKATSTVPAHTLYTINATLDATIGGTDVKSTDIADGKALAKGDIIVAAEIAGTWYIDAVVEATKDAVVAKITEKAVSFKDAGEAKLAKVFKDVAATTVPATMIDYVDGKPQTADYYIYNGAVIFSTAADAVADSYNYALLLYVDEASDPVHVDNKVIINYPAVLLIDGKQTTVNLKASDAIDGKTAKKVIEDGTYAITTESDNETLKYNYTLVTYTVNKDGEYTLKTVNTDLGLTKVVAAGAAFTINTNTGLISIGGNKVVLDDASVIYYTYNKDAADDNYTYLGTYTAANMLAKFDDTTIAQAAYLLDNEDGTYTLIATVLGDELAVTGAPANKTYANDARLIKYSVAASAAEAVDGVAYYSYAFLDVAAMKNGALALDTTKSVADGAVKAAAGKFYGWDENAETYVEVSATAANTSAVQIGTLTAANSKLGIVDLAGTTWADGIKLGADVKIFGAAKNNSAVDYKVFDIAGLEALLEEVAEYNEENSASIVINCAVGTYTEDTDNDGTEETLIAWIIVDNYYDVENADGTTTFTKAYDLVGAID